MATDLSYITWNYGARAVPRAWLEEVARETDTMQPSTLTTIDEARQALKEAESPYRVMSAGRRFGRSNTKPDLDSYDS